MNLNRIANGHIQYKLISFTINWKLFQSIIIAWSVLSMDIKSMKICEPMTSGHKNDKSDLDHEHNLGEDPLDV